MKYHLKKLSLLALLFPALMFAAPTNTNKQTIQLSKYYAATCSDYTGTWRGFFTNPTDLFGNGGPWPVTVSLYNKGANVVGRVSSRKAPGYVSGTMQGMIWSKCNTGQLSNIFMGKPNQCGAYSQTGLLISKNVLVLEIHYQNAMNDAPFFLFLKRINNKFQGKLPKNLNIAAPKTCH